MMSANESQVLRLTTEAAIRLALLTALVAGCLRIVWPFLLPVIWGIIIAIAVWPIIRRLTAVIGGRQKTASALFVLLALAILIVPSWLVAESVTETVIHAGERLASGEVTIPAPPEQVAEWPVIGGKLERVWTKAVENPPAAIEAFRPQIIAIGGVLLSSVAGLGMGVLLFAFSIILAGVFLATSKGGVSAALAVCVRVFGPVRGPELQKTAANTVSSVVKGVLGVAIVQAVAAMIGMLLAGVPAATTWGLLVLLLAVVQLPPFLILAPMCFYVFSRCEPG